MELDQESNQEQSLERNKKRKERAQKQKEEREARSRALREEQEAHQKRLKLEQEMLEQERLEQRLEQEGLKQERLEQERKIRLEKWEDAKTPYEILIFRRIRGVIAEEGSIDVEEVWPNSSFCNDLGFDELDIIKLQMRLEEELDPEMDLAISAEDWDGIVCIDALLNFLVKEGEVEWVAEEMLDANEDLYSCNCAFTDSFVIEMVSKFLVSPEKQQISMKDNLIQDLSLDEVKIVEIVEEIENRRNIEIEDQKLEKIRNVRDIWCLLNWRKTWSNE